MERFIDIPFHKDEVDDSGKFKGYGSVFGGKPDSYRDIIANGAFKKSISKGGRNGSGVAMLYQHNSEQPLGVWESITEDSKGLVVEGQIAVETQLGHDVHILMKMGAIKGLSIGWDFPRGKDGMPVKGSYDFDQSTKTRTLNQIDLWEVSPVTFPAQTRARITGVKSLKEAQTVRELEQSLRDMGLSQSQATYIAGMCKHSLGEATGHEATLLDSLATAIKSESDSRGLHSVLNCLNTTNQKLIHTGL